MKHVLTEYYSLKKELEHTQSRIEEQDRLLLNFDRREAAMIAKISKDERKPLEGFTYMQLKTRNPKIQKSICLNIHPSLTIFVVKQI